MASTAQYKRDAAAAARRFGLDPSVFKRQINQESGFNPHAKSPAGAIGIAQIMPGTAKGWGVDPNDPKASLNAAAKNMAAYVKKYGSYENALRAYNAGGANVKASHGFSETNNYVRTILGGSSPSTKGVGQASASDSSTSSEAASGSSDLLRALSLDKPVLQGATLQAPEFAAQAPTAAPVAAPAGAYGAPALSVAASPLLPKPTIEDAIAAQQAQATDTAAPAAADASTSSAAPATTGKVEVASGADRAGVGLKSPVKSFLSQVSGALGAPVKVTTGSNHNRMTTSGNVSDHWDGNAADLGMGGDARQDKAVSSRGDKVAARAIQVASGMSYGKSLALARKGGIHNFQTKKGRVQVIWKTLEGGDHFNHVHVGVNPNR